MKQFTATANDEGVRLSRFVQSVTRDLPTSLLYKSFRNKRVKVNGKKGAPEDRLKAGDLIELYINDEFFPPEGAKPAARKPAPKKQQNQPKVTVIYEDENIAVLYKPTHLLCHSDRTGDANLVDAFTQYLAQKGEYDAGGENRFKPGICNRLDRGTEGLVIAAKSYAALRDMNEIIRTDLLKKEYYTITVGIPQSGRFTAWWAACSQVLRTGKVKRNVRDGSHSHCICTDKRCGHGSDRTSDGKACAGTHGNAG